ncbi:MAG: glycosyltransferase family 2 protein [Parcubacteria group bacterium]|jgi:GT2 family glycosyltransferase
MKELISVIIPNRAGEKNETLPYLKKQTYKNLQIIEVIDKDGKGASWARNTGYKKAKGKFIFFCDNDLALEKDCIENLYKALKENKEASWAFGRFTIDSVEFNKNKGAIPEDKWSEAYLEWFCGISTMSLIRAEVNPVFDEKRDRFNDWDLWIRITRAGFKPVFVDKILFKTKNRPHGISMGKNHQDAKKELFEKHLKIKIADIVIPHHDQHKYLWGCLERISNRNFNIIIVSGGTFAENCNKGARIATTDNIIFLNDDTEPIEDVLKAMVEDDSDITGVAQFIPELRNTFYGIGHNRENNMKAFLSAYLVDVDVPSGYCFKVKRKAWEKLGGLNEIFKNGCEDRDLFLRANEMGMTFGYVENPMIHFLSKSEGRFNYAGKMEELAEKMWGKKLPKMKFQREKKSSRLDKVNFLTKFVAKTKFYYKGKLYGEGNEVDVALEDKELLRKKGCIN